MGLPDRLVARIETAIQTLAQPHGDTQQGTRTYIPSLSSLQRYASAVGCRFKALSADAKPRFEMVFKVMQALGLKLQTAPASLG